jgi:N4-gp56 family major capsid protein
MLNATASVINCTGGVDGDNPTELTLSDIQGVIRTLATANAKRITDSIEGDLKFGTNPIRQAWFAMGHTDLIPSLENVQGFTSAAMYPFKADLLTSEWGSVANIRFLLSSLGTKITNGSKLGNNMYSVYVTGQESYGTIELDGASAQFIYRPLGYGDDPLMLRQSAGFKFANAQRILNDQWIVNMRCTTPIQY